MHGKSDSFHVSPSIVKKSKIRRFAEKLPVKHICFHVDSVPGDKSFLHLDLDNFDADGVPDDVPYVLTSPTSLEACKRLRVQVSR